MQLTRALITPVTLEVFALDETRGIFRDDIFLEQS